MVVGHEYLQAKALLVQVADTANLLRPRLGPGKRRQQQGRENRHDGNDHQQFNERECSYGLEVCFHAGLDNAERGMSRRLTIKGLEGRRRNGCDPRDPARW